jgi:Protein of unknown function (DUF4058)
MERKGVMPMHDWTMVEAGIFHAFHHRWISAISDTLNAGLLPHDYYALLEQQAAGFGPDVPTLQGVTGSGGDQLTATPRSATLLSRPRTRFTAESDAEFYRRKKSSVVVRHVTGDRIVSMVEIVSPGNKSSRHGIRAYLDKACELLEARVHLLIVDPFPPGRRDASGIHAAIWEEVRDEPFQPPEGKPLTLVAYECGLTTRAYIEPVAVGEVLPQMPLFLEPDGCVMVPLELTYQTAFDVLPLRWRNVLEPPTSRASSAASPNA